MRLASRVGKLEATEPYGAAWLPDGFDLEAELKRFYTAAERLDKMFVNAADLPEGSALAELMARQMQSVEDIVQKLLGNDGTSYQPERLVRMLEEARRWPQVLVLFFGKLPPELRMPMARSSALSREYREDNWIYCWLEDLAELRCRLPPCLTPEALGRVIDVYRTTGPADRESNAAVCLACGMRFPVRKLTTQPITFPDFKSCPACGATGALPRDWWTWTTRSSEHPFEWRAEAEAELKPKAR